jgi:hypothetical protein
VLVCVVENEFVTLEGVGLVLVWVLVMSSVSMMLCDVDGGNELDCVLTIVVGACIVLSNSVSVM